VYDILRRISGLLRVAIEVWSGIEGKMLRNSIGDNGDV
jgi:hypothetical protein